MIGPRLRFGARHHRLVTAFASLMDGLGLGQVDRLIKPEASWARLLALFLTIT